LYFIKNSVSAGIQRIFEELKAERSEVFLILWGVGNALMQLVAL
jgi:hypothetical protein